jgi:L-ribulose-5-phosphate 3-epimerase
MSTIKLGVLARLEAGPEQLLQEVGALGFPTCQVSTGQGNPLDETIADRLRAAATAAGVEISTIWATLPGRHVWDFLEGPTTIGLVPATTRADRLAVLKRSADFAVRVGVPSITTHVGFIPENPLDPAYQPVVEALREIAVYCAERDLQFWFETGQETPITLLRTIEEIGTDNLGINLDPANLLMYGRGNPVDALDVFGKYVRGVHAKDGEYPTNGRQLGVEKSLGQGRVNFPALLGKLKALGFSGALTIEREISGPQQLADIKQGKQLLEQILRELNWR